MSPKKRPINKSMLPKKFEKVLNAVANYLYFHKVQGRPLPKSVALFRDDYRELANALHDMKLNIEEVTYLGVTLTKHAE